MAHSIRQSPSTTQQGDQGRQQQGQIQQIQVQLQNQQTQPQQQQSQNQQLHGQTTQNQPNTGGHTLSSRRHTHRRLLELDEADSKIKFLKYDELELPGGIDIHISIGWKWGVIIISSFFGLSTFFWVVTMITKNAKFAKVSTITMGLVLMIEFTTVLGTVFLVPSLAKDFEYQMYVIFTYINILLCIYVFEFCVILHII